LKIPLLTHSKLTLQKSSYETLKAYWRGKNIPQQWYSDREPRTLGWFNDLRHKRYTLYYEYLARDAEFQYHAGERVLEVGCGIGTDLAEYALHGAKVCGVDLGPEQVELTKLNFQLRGLPYDEIKEGNAEDLPFEDKTFDLVFCFGVLHHTVNPQKGIDEIFRVLKDDGRAIVMLYARGWKHYLKRCLIHGLILGKWFRAGLNWKKVYNEVSEVHGHSPRTEVYTKREVKRMFSRFRTVEIHKRRLGEFIEYPPYRTFTLPPVVRNFLYFCGLEAWLGENWLIKAHKAAPPPKTSVFDVIFRHY